MKKIGALLVVSVLFSVNAQAACGEFMDKFLRAQNSREIDQFVALFSKDYISFPIRAPQNAFQGSDRVRANWSNIFSLGLSRTGRRDFVATVGPCFEEKNADGSSNFRYTQTWRGAFDAQGQNPCLDENVYMNVRVQDGQIVYGELSLSPEMGKKISACLN